MNPSGARRSDESQSLHFAAEPHAAIVGNEAARRKIETVQLLVLCTGIAGLIMVDVLIFIYFWAI